MITTPERILDDPGLLLAVCELRCKSMNGATARRLTIALEDLARDRLDRVDAGWLADSTDTAAPRREFWAEQVDALTSDGVDVVPCWSSAYPVNLAMIHDRPPVLFVRGSIIDDDRRAVAVVGARTASPRGIEMAGALAGALAARGVTIVSGLAKGIDTAAHASAINTGGRTIAVYGTPIDRVYPAANRGLARTIAARHGACVSQFLPTTATGPWSFPVRNITTSGLAVGTIVVEAGETSGAKLQAEAAIAHGKKVFLVDELVTAQPWARAMATEPTVTVAADAEAIVAGIDAELGVGDVVLL